MVLHIRKLGNVNALFHTDLYILDQRVYLNMMLVQDKQILSQGTWDNVIIVRMLYAHFMDIVNPNKEIIHVYVHQNIVVQL
jgi:hypothetical protein